MNEMRRSTTEFVERKATQVRIITTAGTLEGLYHHPPGVRLSDSLRNAATGERYVMLTDVTVTEGDGKVSASPFVLVASAAVSVIIPLEED
jgi:hypothetical protein